MYVPVAQVPDGVTALNVGSSHCLDRTYAVAPYSLSLPISRRSCNASAAACLWPAFVQ